MLWKGHAFHKNILYTQNYLCLLSNSTVVANRDQLEWTLCWRSLELVWKEKGTVDGSLGIPVISVSPPCRPVIVHAPIVGLHVERGAGVGDELVQEVRGPHREKRLEMLRKLLPIQIYPAPKQYHKTENFVKCTFTRSLWTRIAGTLKPNILEKCHVFNISRCKGSAQTALCEVLYQQTALHAWSR